MLTTKLRVDEALALKVHSSVCDTVPLKEDDFVELAVHSSETDVDRAAVLEALVDEEYKKDELTEKIGDLLRLIVCGDRDTVVAVVEWLAVGSSLAEPLDDGVLLPIDCDKVVVVV